MIIIEIDLDSHAGPLPITSYDFDGPPEVENSCCQPTRQLISCSMVLYVSVGVAASQSPHQGNDLHLRNRLPSPTLTPQSKQKNAEQDRVSFTKTDDCRICKSSIKI